jgi:hypothetical protein
MKENEIIPNMALDTFKEFYLPNSYDENMFRSDGSLNPHYNSYKKTGIIAEIFEDHWDEFYSLNKELIDKYRPNAPIEVKKIIDCYNKNLGCSVFECPNCHDCIFVGHTCKSRLCSSCGYKYKLERVENILETAYKCPHRQVVFTIPKELRAFFFYPFEERIAILFQAVSETIYSILRDNYKISKSPTKKKKKKYSSKTLFTPGFFSFLHTFGRDLKWNPHIHVLIAEIKLGNNGSIKKWDYFNYDALSKRFQKILLDLLSKNIGEDFNSLKRKLFLNYKNGFYVYAEKKEFKSFKNGIEYVTRYCGRCAISENRIKSYDGKNVTFFYNAHEDESYHEVTVSAAEFIFMILRHLVPTNFKIIRYYGFYRKKHNLHDKMVLLIDKAKRFVRKQFLKHENSISLAFKREIYNCPRCNVRMEHVVEIT